MEMYAVLCLLSGPWPSLCLPHSDHEIVAPLSEELDIRTPGCGLAANNWAEKFILEHPNYTVNKWGCRKRTIEE